jgi:hypothetical protein
VPVFFGAGLFRLIALPHCLAAGYVDRPRMQRSSFASRSWRSVGFSQLDGSAPQAGQAGNTPEDGTRGSPLTAATSLHISSHSSQHATIAWHSPQRKKRNSP